MKVNILGTEWTISECSAEEDKVLEMRDVDGYCDKTTKRIVIIKKPDVSDLGNWDVYRKKVLRHEIIHAFLFESGLHENCSHPAWGHDEAMIDWVAVQFHKLQQAFKEADCL